MTNIETPLPDLLTGLPFAVNYYLADTYKAVKLDGTIHVSPAVWSLMKTADSDELEHLLRNLPLLDLDKYAIESPSVGQRLVARLKRFAEKLP